MHATLYKLQTLRQNVSVLLLRYLSAHWWKRYLHAQRAQRPNSHIFSPVQGYVVNTLKETQQSWSLEKQDAACNTTSGLA